MIDQNTRLLSFCPTRGRPHKLKDLLESFDKTKSVGTEMLVYVAHNDDCLEEYKNVLNGRNFVIGEKNRCLVEVVNHITCELYPNMPYYQCLNDDHYIHTKGFDNILIDKIQRDGKGWGIAFGRSLVNEDIWKTFRHPSAEVISGNIPRTLGYYCTPLLQHLQADTFCRDIGEGINKIFRVMEVVIEHRHFINGKSEMDEGYRNVYSKEQQKIGWDRYAEYNNVYFNRDIDKILKAIALGVK